MNLYQIYVDIPLDDDWDEIEVIDLEIEAYNCDEAYEKAVEEMRAQAMEDFYVWEVTEEDLIQKL